MIVPSFHNIDNISESIRIMGVVLMFLTLWVIGTDHISKILHCAYNTLHIVVVVVVVIVVYLEKIYQYQLTNSSDADDKISSEEQSSSQPPSSSSEQDIDSDVIEIVELDS